MRLHRYRGRENGLMVIGTASELRSLANALLAFAADKPEKAAADWPPRAMEVPIAPDFPLSFHLETTSGEKPASNLP